MSEQPVHQPVGGGDDEINEGVHLGNDEGSEADVHGYRGVRRGGRGGVPECHN